MVYVLGSCYDDGPRGSAFVTSARAAYVGACPSDQASFDDLAGEDPGG